MTLIVLKGHFPIGIFQERILTRRAVPLHLLSFLFIPCRLEAKTGISIFLRGFIAAIQARKYSKAGGEVFADYFRNCSSDLVKSLVVAILMDSLAIYTVDITRPPCGCASACSSAWSHR